jgi:hypothetical protein
LKGKQDWTKTEEKNIPSHGPFESSTTVATLPVLLSLAMDALVTTARTSSKMPPITKTASKPRKTKKTAFTMLIDGAAVRLPDLAICPR